MAREPTYSFGPFELDLSRRRLSRDGDAVALPDRHIDILHLLVSRAGDVIAKDALVEAGWKDVAVSDNSLEQAMSSLRRRLGPAPDAAPYIETHARRGYRFRVPVEASVTRESDEALLSRLLPHRVFIEGRAAVETLGRDAVSRAAEAFREVLALEPDYASAHIGLANAMALLFDSTRFSEAPDVGSIARAVHHAREACRLDSASGEAWATLAFVLSRTGAGADAVAAGRHATALEPDSWRHHVRLAYAAWGDERLKAARSALRQLPGVGLAHWLAATVHVARQAFDEALRDLEAGVSDQDAQPEGGRFGSVGLHLQLGLVHLALGDEVRAESELDRELAFEPAGHVYSAQACANAWCALGALRIRQNRNADAVAAFEQTLDRAPGHQMALAALVALTRGARREALRSRFAKRLALLEGYGVRVDAAAAAAVADVFANRHRAAADRVAAALEAATDRGSTGWGIPVEPLLAVSLHPGEWAHVLALLRTRAA